MFKKEYDLLVTVENCKYSRQQHIKVEANNREEAKQKAINMGYKVISIR